MCVKRSKAEKKKRNLKNIQLERQWGKKKKRSKSGESEEKK